MWKSNSSSETTIIRNKSVLKSRQVPTYAAFIAVWVLVNLFFWSWWFNETHMGNRVLFIIMSLALLYESTILPTFYIFFLGRMREPEKIHAPQGVRVAMITLCVPAKESIEVIERQLQAIANVRYPHDSWILDEGNDFRIKKLADSLGVYYFSRQGIRKYNQPSQPFKAKTKAGNVNAWINLYGNFYDYFTQLDIDHNPRPSYLDRVLGYFQDKDVAWVQPPSIYNNLDDYWTARGSAEQELGLQGPLQAGFYGWSGAPFIIGSHTTYRMKAVQEIGGYQPTRAEDHLDTLVLASRGYRGVYLPETIAWGSGPESFDAYADQQFAWAYSMIQVLFFFTPRLLRKFNLRQALQFLFVGTWYPLWSITMAILFLIPAYSLAINIPIANMGYLDALWRFIPIPMTALCIWLWSRKWFQPKGVSLSWRGLVLHIARWPIVLWAFISVLLGIQKPYMNTPKGIQKGESRPFSLSIHLPHFGFTAIMLISGLFFIFIFGKGIAQGYLFFVLQNSLLMALIFSIVLFADMKALTREGAKLKRIFRLRAIPLSALVFSLVLTAVVGILAKPQVAEAMAWGNSLDVVEMPEGVLYGAFDPDGVLENQSLDIEHHFIDWSDTPNLRFSIENARWKGRFPMITLEPWPKSGKMETLLEDINNGEYDRTIRRSARIVASQFPQEIIIRWGHEMELIEIYPWAGNPNEYSKAYQRVVKIFRDQGATNAFWLWSPAGNYDAFYYYPGDEYVDFIGVTVLSDPVWDDMVTGKENPGYLDYASRKFWVTNYFQKPLIVAELGISNPDLEIKHQWLQTAVDSLDDYPTIKALVYFNDENVIPSGTSEYYPDWRISLETWDAFTESSSAKH